VVITIRSECRANIASGPPSEQIIGDRDSVGAVLAWPADLNARPPETTQVFLTGSGLAGYLLAVTEADPFW
jgi:hypothetical protein